MLRLLWSTDMHTVLLQCLLRPLAAMYNHCCARDVCYAFNCGLYHICVMLQAANLDDGESIEDDDTAYTLHNALSTVCLQLLSELLS
jgi:hypothetical protein